MTRHRVLLPLLCLAAACTDQRRAVAATWEEASEAAPPIEAHVSGHLARGRIVESSGLAASASRAGVLFTINDSGNEPVLYAIDTSGADRGAWRVTGAVDVDWESIAVGPCGQGAGVVPGPPRCVYVGDTGDNLAHHDTRTIYRVPEPDAAGPDGTGRTPPAERLVYRYEGGARDVEAITVGPDGAIALYTKRPLRDAAGRRRPSLVFRLTAGDWSAGDTAVARLVDSLPSIVPGEGAGGGLVTDASLSPDLRHVAVRTYSEVYVYDADPATGRIVRGARPTVCGVDALREPGGEGVAWIDATTLLLSSEGEHEALHVVRCAMPATR